MSIPIIIDTDPGHDDALALMLAARCDAFDIRAITTVAGNSSIENTTRNARYVLKLLDKEDIPIYSGAAAPLTQPLIQAVVHGKSGLAGIDPSNEPELTGDAVDRIIDIVKTSQKPITIITLGPLTNIAQAIQKAPDTLMSVERIVMMGGAIDVPGNKNRVAEFNIFVDPDAADVVFKSPMTKTLVPLDACNHVQLTLDDFRGIEDKNIRDAVLAMMKPYIANTLKEEGVEAALMYDPLTVYAVMNPAACQVKDYDIVIETTGATTRGMTVAERRITKKGSENVTVVERVDAKVFTEDFIRILNGR